MPQPMQQQPAAEPSAQDQQGNMQGGMSNQQSLAPQNPQDAGKKIVDGMMAVQAALSGFGQMLSGKVPPSALKDLQVAIKSYDAFLSQSMQAMGVEAPEMEGEDENEGPQSDMSAKGAVPAEQMSGGNPNAKQVY